MLGSIGYLLHAPDGQPSDSRYDEQSENHRAEERACNCGHGVATCAAGQGRADAPVPRSREMLTRLLTGKAHLRWQATPPTSVGLVFGRFRWLLHPVYDERDDTDYDDRRDEDTHGAKKPEDE